MNINASHKCCSGSRMRPVFRRVFPALIIISVMFAALFYFPAAKDIYAADNSKIIICIDPGHGGKDTGTIGPSGFREKDANLDISLRLRDKLAGAGFKVIMTRESDVNHTFEEIANYANSSGATLFISIHNNSHPSPAMNGTQVFYFGNSAGGRSLASTLSAKIREQAGTVDRGVRSANFRVLRNTVMISALVEGVFMCNPDEEAKLKDENFRDKIATGVFNGIIEFLKSGGKDIAVASGTSTAQSFVRRIYNKGLNVNPDDATLNDWAAKLAGGKISYPDFIRNILGSKQFTDRNLTDSQFIDILYQAVLDRNPDSAGRSFWIGQLRMLSRLAVINCFLASGEFTGLVNQYLKSGYSYTGNVQGTGSSGAGSVASITISILNGVGIRGIAARTSELFKSKYKVYYVADADSYSYQSTQIRCKSENPDIMKAAEEIKSILRTGTINIQTGTQVSDIVIIIGRDYASGGTSNTGSGSADISTGPVLVNVLNGQGTPGIAAKVKIEIETYTRNNGNGIKVTEAKNASSFGYRNTRIIIFTSRDGVNESAENLKKLLGVGDILKSAYNVDNVDITVVLGNDYRK